MSYDETTAEALAVTSVNARARPTATSQKQIELEIEGGLKNQVQRMRDAWECLRYSMARFEEFPSRHKDQRYKSPSVRRTTRIFGRFIDVLCMHLYKKQPTRKLADPVLSEWLETVYRRNYVGAKIRRLQELTLIGGFAALQFAGGTDPAMPLKVTIWGADQLAYWVAPDDPTKVDAVATMDKRDNQRFLTLWTRDQVVEYVTTKGIEHAATGGTAYRLQSRKANPYVDREGLGIIPFAFAHWTFPASEFEENSPGLNLKELNQGVNERLDNLGDSIYFNCKPLGVAEGVDDGWAPPTEIKPGDFIKLPADNVDLGGNGPVPTLKYLMPDLNYVTKDWEDMTASLDLQLEMWGIPQSIFRMSQSAVASGAAMQTEQLPIIGWVEGRQPDWACYEEEFAKRGMEVAAAHLDNVGLSADADALYAYLDDWQFALRWASMNILLPGPEKDRSDDWRLNHNLVSLVGIIQEREGVSEQEALGIIAKVAEQNQQLKALGIEPNPVGAMAMLKANPFGGMDPNQQQDSDPNVQERPRQGNGP